MFYIQTFCYVSVQLFFTSVEVHCLFMRLLILLACFQSIKYCALYLHEHFIMCLCSLGLLVLDFILFVYARFNSAGMSVFKALYT